MLTTPLRRDVVARRDAFTLIELLVVISIIVLLISILLPALSKALSAARTTQCLSTMRQAFMVFQLYGQDNKDRYPPLLDSDSIVVWTTLLMENDRYVSRMASQRLQIGSGDQVVYTGTFACSERERVSLQRTVTGGDWLGATYGLNIDAYIGQGYVQGLGWPNNVMAGLKYEGVKSPSTMYMLGEQKPGRMGIESNFIGSPPGSEQNEAYVDIPHPGRTSIMLYFDGHAQPVRNSTDLTNYGDREWDTTY